MNFEVLSRSWASADYITNNREYSAIARAARYGLLKQERIVATVFARVDGGWVGHILVEGDDLAMPEIGVQLPQAEL